MNKRLTARNLIFWVFISTQFYYMVSEVKDLGGEDLLKQFECSHHAFMTRYLGWKEMCETKMEAVLRNTCLVQLVKLSRITMA